MRMYLLGSEAGTRLVDAGTVVERTSLRANLRASTAASLGDSGGPVVVGSLGSPASSNPLRISRRPSVSCLK